MSVKRVEDPRLLVGSGAYLDDLRLPGLLHAAFVRSVHAHARVRGVGLESARRAPGVAAVLSGRDLSEWVKPLSPRLEGGGFWPTQWPALAPERTRFVGVAPVRLQVQIAVVDGAGIVGAPERA